MKRGLSSNPLLISTKPSTTRCPIAHANTRTLFVMEGGYAVEEIGINAVSVLRGFEEALS